MSLIDLTGPTLIAPDIFSLIPTIEADIPVESTNSSAPIEQDFSALLTELTGSIEKTPRIEETVRTGETVRVAETAPIEETPRTEKTVRMGKMVRTAETAPIEEPLLIEETVRTGQMARIAATAPIEETPRIEETIRTREIVRTAETAPIEETAPNSPPKLEGIPFASFSANGGVVLQTIQTTPSAPASVASHHFIDGAATPPNLGGELGAEQIWADVRKFEYSVVYEAEQPSQAQVLPRSPEGGVEITPDRSAAALGAIVSKVVHRAPESHEETEPVAPKAIIRPAVVTSDPIVSVRQQQLASRIVVPIRRVETSQADSRRSKEPTTSTEPQQAAPALNVTDFNRPIETIEQPLAAHHVEIPVLVVPRVVRTVAMEVGDTDAPVLIRINERGGDVSLDLNTATESMRHDLQSSVASLVRSLKQADVPVSTINVTRKSPIDKVQRMKEAH